MRRHWKKVALLMAATAIAASVLFALPTREPEPSYQGRNLSQWIDVHSEVTTTQEEEALLHMGTNVLPYLVKWACPPRWRTFLEHLRFKYGSRVPHAFRRWVFKDESRVSLATSAFELLWTNANPALPHLNLIAASSPHGRRADNAQMCISLILYRTEFYWPDLPVKEEQNFRDPNPIVREAATNAHRYLLQHPVPTRSSATFPPPLDMR